MKSTLFKASDLISLLFFLDNIKTACNTNIIHEVAAMCFLPCFLRERAKTALSHQVTADNNSPQQEGKLVTYCGLANYLLETYATDDFIIKAEADRISFR